MRRFWFVFLLFLPLALSSQEEKDAEESVPAMKIFPLALFLEAAEYAPGGCWQPDWPLEMPPDAFILPDNDWVSVTVTLGEESFCLKLDEEGRPLEFPFLFRGSLAQAGLEYSSQGNNGEKLLSAAYIRGKAGTADMTGESGPVEETDRDAGYTGGAASASAEDMAVSGDPSVSSDPAASNGPAVFNSLVKIEVLEYIDNYPSILRVDEDSLYSFVLLRKGVSFISESWFDRDGLFLGGYEYGLTQAFGRGEPVPQTRIYRREAIPGAEEEAESRSFDSRFLLTGINGRRGDFSVEYFLENLPRYWTRKPFRPEEDGGAEDTEKGGHYGFQWDETGLLVRLVSSGDASGAEDEFFDSRYDYTLDERGNWIERRETKMSRLSGYLVPGTGPSIRRVPEYLEPEQADE